MELNLNVIGTCLMSLALIHAFFPKHFRWKSELASLNLINAQMMRVHTFFIALTVLLNGTVVSYLCSSPYRNTLG